MAVAIQKRHGYSILVVGFVGSEGRGFSRAVGGSYLSGLDSGPPFLYILSVQT